MNNYSKYPISNVLLTDQRAFLEKVSNIPFCQSIDTARIERILRNGYYNEYEAKWINDNKKAWNSYMNSKI